MILSNVEIHRAIDEGRIVIRPEPLPRLPSMDGGHCPYDTHTVDVTLGDTLLIPAEGVAISINLARPASVIETIRRNSNRHVLSEQPYILEPRKFVLGQTREWIELPLQKDADRSLAARIEGKSSRARFGLLIHFTAPTVHPNFRGTLTLEMINLGAFPIELTPGLPVAQLIFEEVRGIPVRNDSQFQGQREPAGPARKRASRRRQS